jgi:Iodothyronine deiodinase
MKNRYADQVQFLSIYVREAHPTDGWRSEGNDRAGVVFAQPRSVTERRALADKCCQSLQMSMPLLIDELDDRVGHLYSGMPDRLYLIDRAGRVVYKGGRGPFGFKPGELEQSLVLLLAEEPGEGTPEISPAGEEVDSAP